MNITFICGPVPELTIKGSELAASGFTIDTPIRLTLRDNTLSVTTVADEAEWEALCEASQQWQDSGADWVRDNGEEVIGGSWLTGFGFIETGHLEITAAPGGLWLWR